MKKFIFLITLIFLLGISSELFAWSDQATSERILKENKNFVEFIDLCLSNFARDKSDEFFKIYQKHFNADVAFLQSDYKRTYHRIYSSQGDMVKIYEKILLNYYLEDSKKLLDSLAPNIIRSKNSKARLYLTLGYRDRTVSWNYYTIGEASNPKLRSYILYKYEEAIKMARRAKRYAFLALFESEKPEIKIDIFNKLLETEKGKGNKFYGRFLGLNDDAFNAELNKTYDVFEKDEMKKKSAPFEMKLKKRIRFREEKKCAGYLRNHDFEQAKDIIREYVDDFNFKIIFSTLNLLNEKKKGGRINYEEMKLHLFDNYLRLGKEKKSLLDSFLDKVKVEDSVKSRKTQNDDEKKTSKNDKAIENEKSSENKTTEINK